MLPHVELDGYPPLRVLGRMLTITGTIGLCGDREVSLQGVEAGRPMSVKFSFMPAARTAEPGE